MKKLILLALPLLLACCLAGCKKNVNYLDYVSEKRTDIYLYSDDKLEIKIYLSEKETPFCADGIKGAMGELTEIYVTLPENHEEVSVSAGSIEGEMNYRAVENCYYLRLPDGKISGESAEVTLTYGGESHTYSAVSVLYDGVIGCDGAVNCVIDRETELFRTLTENNVFLGEIYVRLLYDEGCYYYVGVCDRNNKINAYLVDGERGKVIASKELDA